MKIKKIFVGGVIALSLVGFGATRASAVWVGTVPLKDKLTLGAKLVSRTTMELRVSHGYTQHQSAYYQVGNYLYCDYWYDTY